MLIISLLLIYNFKISFHYRVENSHLIKEWEEYKSEYNLDFSAKENEYRKGIFMKNYQFIMNSNSRNLNLNLKMNKFGHLDKNERPGLVNLKKRLGAYEHHDPLIISQEIPLNYDWREKGVVSSVSDQGNCGSGYAFSAVDAIESQFAIHTGNLTDLSKEEIIDCSISYGNNACKGGDTDHVYQYCIENGLSTYSDYLYNTTQEHCKRDNSNSSYKLIGYKWLKKGDEDNLVRALYHIGPISIGMDADHKDFHFYNSGIIDTLECSSDQLNHFVLAVGYNLSETPYLLVKNSYGTAWGMEGYFKIALHNYNMCGISSQATFPIIAPKY